MGSEAPSNIEEEILAQLALARRFLAAQSENAEIELKPGELAIELPLPPGSRVVGSLMRGGQPASMLIDAPLTQDEALAFCDEQLPAHGWVADVSMQRGGFVPFTPPFFPSRYISHEHGKMLILVIREHVEGSSTLLIKLADAPDRWQWARRPHEPVLQQAMPTLRAPRGASLTTEGGGGSDMSWRTYARMTSALSTEAVMASFDKQLEAGGWRRLDSQASGAAGWSLWSVSVESRSMIGALVVLRIPERQNAYLLEARIEAEERQQPSGGWFSYAPLIGGDGPARPR